MFQQLTFDLGKEYKTRGGWKAIVIWKSSFAGRPGFFCIHQPNKQGESLPVYHDAGGRAISGFSVNEPPVYNGHPADLIAEWSEDANLFSKS